MRCVGAAFCPAVLRMFTRRTGAYYTFLGLGTRGSEFQQWQELKAAACEALVAHGGTVTHHHAVGRVHKPWYDRQRPDLFADALRAAKSSLDPEGIMNPGVLIDP